MYKCSKQKLNKRNKYTAKQANRISATFDTDIAVYFIISVNKAIFAD